MKQLHALGKWAPFTNHNNSLQTATTIQVLAHFKIVITIRELMAVSIPRLTVM